MRLVVAYGNGTGFHALRHSAPSPTTGLLKRFRAKAHEGLVLIHTPEYCSSKMCSRCGEKKLEEDPRRTYKKVQKVRTDDEEIECRLPKLVPLWSIRRCNSVTCGGRHWNRDHNAAINIRANLLHYLDKGTWPQHALKPRPQPAPQQQHEDRNVVIT